MTINANISIPNLLSNYDVIARAAPNATLAPVVKADAYGLGAENIVRALDSVKSPHLYYVATLEEALEIRPLTQADIVVFGGMQQGQENAFSAHNLTPALKSLGDLKLWQSHAAALEKILPCHIHLDTAINRTGVQMDEDGAATACLEGLDIRYIISHFVSSEETENPLNTLQRKRFISRAAQYELAYGREIKKSMANSSAIVNFPDMHFDMVRSGGGLWGIEMGVGQAQALKPVLSMDVKILQVSAIKTGETIGYNELFTAQSPCRIATLAIGYADGLHWPASNNAKFYWRGKPCTIAGSVSMDLTTVIIPDGIADDEMPCAGAFMELIGPRQRIETLAQDCGARGYEMQIALCGGRRASRHI